MKIAIHVNDGGEPVSLYEKGEIRLYEGAGQDWALLRSVPFEIGNDAKLSEVKAKLERAVLSFDDCQTLISGDTRGFLYSFIQEQLGYNIWTSGGTLDEQMEGVEQKTKEREAGQAAAAAAGCGCGSTPAVMNCSSGGCGGGARRRAFQLSGNPPEAKPQTAELVSNGHYRFDLVKAMADNPAINSRMALIPVLTDPIFETLDILLDHCPRWFPQKVDDLGLKARFEILDTPSHALKVSVSRESTDVDGRRLDA